MNLLQTLKKNSVVRAIIRETKKTAAGRAVVARAVGALRAAAATRGTAGADGWFSSPSQQQDFHILRAQWRDQGPSAELLAQARAMESNTIAWGALHPSTWLIYVSALAEGDEPDTAERVLRRYIAKYGDTELANVLPVARFARDVGLRSRVIDRAASITDALDGQGGIAPFAALVGSKTVAVVGNGPGNLDSGRGAEIDAHDIVIRFNNYPDGFEADYGARTDVWVRGAHADVRDRHDLQSYALVLWEMDLLRNFLEHPSHHDILYRDTLFTPEKVGWIDSETKSTLREASGLMLATSGAQVLWALHRARRGDMRGVDVYGFSSLDGHAELGHYFDDLGDMEKRHDMAAEGAFLRALVKGGAVAHRDDRITVFGAAYREYDPSRGRTGGPAGVLATQRVALGDEHDTHELRYIFDEGDKTELRRSIAPRLAGLSGKAADILLGAEYFSAHPDVVAAQQSGRRLLAVCHDLGSALGAHQLGIPYVIVYHQQGSTLQEMASIGREASAHEAAAVARLEEVVCLNAQRMYFPSLGACEAFKVTAAPGLAEKVDFASSALYNTVSAVDHGNVATAPELPASLRRELRLPAPGADTDVFMSVGDWNGDKGLDRVPALLDGYTRRSGRRVLWIAIGSASDPERFTRAQASQQTWAFESRLIGRRMAHEKLLALLGYADYYVMMHRNSIFDLATLEAMRAGLGLILTPVGGNLEVNLDDNVEFVTDDSIPETVDAIIRRDRVEWGARNRAVFERSFSLDQFAARYRAMLDEQIAQLFGDARK